MHPLYRYIAANNSYNPVDYQPFHVAGLPLGRLHGRVVAALADSPFIAQNQGVVALKPEAESVEGRTAALDAILHQLIKKGLVAKQRHELYRVAAQFSDAPVALADRALMPALGLLSHGVHCNGFIRDGDAVKLWIARRAANASTDPGKFDHVVAGGQPYNYSLRDNLAKEAAEEADIPRALIDQAKPVGIIRYARTHTPCGVRRDTLFVFDCELPATFTPRNNDGEAQDFRLMDVAEIKQRLLDEDAFKFNVSLVLIDFLIRHGYIGCDEPGYDALVLGLRAAF